MTINSYESYANQVQILLKRTKDKFKNLSKKDAIRFLEFALKFPVEHEDVEKLLLKPGFDEIKDYIIQVQTAKSNMVVTFLHEHGNELHQEALLKKQAEKEETGKNEVPETDPSKLIEFKGKCDGECGDDCCSKTGEECCEGG